MNKAELIQNVAAESGLSQADTTRAINALTEVITKTLAKGKGDAEVTLTGIAKFSVTKTKPRTARNPRTGEQVKVPAGRRVKASISKTLKDAVNG